MTGAAVDPSFTALPLAAMAHAALQRAGALAVQHAEFTAIRIREQAITLRDAEPDGINDTLDIGISVRVVHDGTWGYAAGVALTADAAAELAERAVEVATVCRP